MLTQQQKYDFIKYQDEIYYLQTYNNEDYVGNAFVGTFKQIQRYVLKYGCMHSYYRLLRLDYLECGVSFIPELEEIANGQLLTNEDFDVLYNLI